MLELALGVAAGFVFFEAFVRARKTRAASWALFFFLLLAALFRTGSRFGSSVFVFLSFVAGTAMAFKQPKARPWVALAASTVLALLVAQSGVFFKRFALEAGYLEASSGRWWVWQDALAMLRPYGLWGTGLGGFGRAFPQFQSARLLMGWDHAHNDYLEMAIELGLPVFLLWMAGWIALGWGLVQKILKDTTGRAWLAGGISLGLLSMVIHGLADFNFAIPANRFLFVLLTGLAYRLVNLPDLHEDGGRAG